MTAVKCMLDTNICIYIIKKDPRKVLNKFTGFSPGEICISSITMSELYYGANKSQHIHQNLLALENFLLPLEVLSFDDRAAMFYGEIRAYLEKNGTPIGPLDMLIAAHAVSLDLPLVTNNTKKFSKIRALSYEDWTTI